MALRQIKERIQNKLNNICYEKYEREVTRQEDSYRQWYLGSETWKARRFPKPDPEIVIFADRGGVTEKKAAGVVTAFFREHPYVQIAYADEDCIKENGRRYAPWFKPQWSPDTFDSFQYFGHFFAVRRELLDGIPAREWESCLADCSGPECYLLLKKLTAKVTQRRFIRANDKQKEIAPIGKVLIHMKEEKADAEFVRAQRRSGDLQGRTEQGTEPLISILIPSKDNPHVLRTCISSIREKTKLESGDGLRLALEIIVVDNGSSSENRILLEAMAREYNFTYLYEPMPFNFSKMCNLGAARSTGNYLLLLNDDMEIIEPLWLLRLFAKASLPHAGAVGAKLLYPGSDVIQHIGITNIKVGPVHKLLKQHDENCYYHGQNRHIYDMIGVTAACLLVAKSKFEEAGGLYEGMAVAYNDVDFCFALYDLGYYNILRNDVVLYHHESLSRGDDNLSDEKWVRLLKEKDILYQRHPHLKGHDPFYSRNLAGHSNLYLSNFQYEFERRDCYRDVKPWRGGDPAVWENGCLTVTVEHARVEKKLETTDRDDVYWIEGWSYVLGMDNCRYRRRLLLHGSAGQVYEAQVFDRYREDVEAILPQQKNVALAGFVCRFWKGALLPDTYTIAVLAEDACSNQKLYQKTEKSFTI